MPKRNEVSDDSDTVISDKSVAETKKKAKAEESSFGQLSEKQSSLLANLMSYHMRGMDDGVSFTKCAADLGFMERTKTWCKAWSDLLDVGLIEACVPGGAKFTAAHRLTEVGKAQASTPEYEEFVRDKNFVAATNEDHQDRIKKRLVNAKNGQRGVQIFDLLLEHGALTRMELCGILGVRSGTHMFSYALKELKDKQLISGTKSEKLRLSDRAFLDPMVDRSLHVSNQETIWMLLSSSKYACEYEYKEGGKIQHNKQIKAKNRNTEVSVKEDTHSSPNGNVTSSPEKRESNDAECTHQSLEDKNVDKEPEIMASSDILKVVVSPTVKEE